jgi:hypothetical protein
MLTPPRSIRITPHPQLGKYSVEILPPLPEGPNHDANFAEYRKARGYAGGLRLALGLPLIDLAAEERD